MLNSFEKRAMEVDCQIKIEELRIVKITESSVDIYIGFETKGTVLYDSSMIYTGEGRLKSSIKDIIESSKISYEKLSKKEYNDVNFSDIYMAVSTRCELKAYKDEYNKIYQKVGSEGRFVEELRDFIKEYRAKKENTSYKEIYKYVMGNYMKYMTEKYVSKSKDHICTSVL